MEAGTVRKQIREAGLSTRKPSTDGRATIRYSIDEAGYNPLTSLVNRKAIQGIGDHQAGTGVACFHGVVNRGIREGFKKAFNPNARNDL